MTAQAFCGACGAPRADGAAFCGACGASYEQPPTAASSPQQGLAGGMLELEKLRMKLIVGRLIGIAVGLLIWWFVIGPTFGDNPLIVLIGLVVLVFGGLYVGGLAVLAQQRR